MDTRKVTYLSVPYSIVIGQDISSDFVACDLIINFEKIIFKYCRLLLCLLVVGPVVK